jgi:hypothetical protein
MNIDPLNGTFYKPDECSPEKRLWIMVLETFVDDMILQNKYIKSCKRRNRINQILLHDTEKLSLLQKANAPHIVEICNSIGICHRWFIRGLTKVKNDPNYTSRPVRVTDIVID